jgi:hypothetical protein
LLGEWRTYEVFWLARIPAPAYEARCLHGEAAMGRDEGREVGEKRRRERLAAALRENLKRRKAQQRGRAVKAEAPNDEPPESVNEGPGV